MGARDGLVEQALTVTSGHCASGIKPNRKDMLLQDTFVILLEVLKTKLGERQLFHSDTPLRPGASHCLRSLVQAQKAFSAAREVPLMIDAMSMSTEQSSFRSLKCKV